jgi:spore germination protein KB
MGEVVFPVYMIATIVVWLLLLSVEGFSFDNLIPVLGNGVKPVLKEVFPYTITFPFGETIIITMFFPILNKKKNARKVGMAVILLGGILLTINSILNIAVLGPEVYANQLFPLLASTKQVSIADFLERFDALIILLIVSGVFFKVGGWTYGASVGISQLFNIKDQRSILLAIGTIIIPLSLSYGDDFVKSIEVGKEFITIYLHIPLQIIVPILLLCIAFIRKKLNPENSSV